MATPSLSARPRGRSGLTLALLGAVALLSIPATADASHYELGDVPSFGAEEVRLLRAMGVEGTAKLIEHLATPAFRSKLAADLKISPERVGEWARICDLLQIRGVGPTMVRLLRAAGVEGCADLAERDAAELATLLARVNSKDKISGKLPGASQILSWQESARTAPWKVL